ATSSRSTGRPASKASRTGLRPAINPSPMASLLPAHALEQLLQPLHLPGPIEVPQQALETGAPAVVAGFGGARSLGTGVAASAHHRPLFRSEVRRVGKEVRRC